MTEVSFSSSNDCGKVPYPRNSSVQKATQKCYKQTPKLKQDKSETSGVHAIILLEKLKNNNQISSLNWCFFTLQKKEKKRSMVSTIFLQLSKLKFSSSKYMLDQLECMMACRIISWSIIACHVFTLTKFQIHYTARSKV